MAEYIRRESGLGSGTGTVTKNHEWTKGGKERGSAAATAAQSQFIRNRLMDARLSQGDRRSRVTVAVDIISRCSNRLLWNY